MSGLDALFYAMLLAHTVSSPIMGHPIVDSSSGHIIQQHNVTKQERNPYWVYHEEAPEPKSTKCK